MAFALTFSRALMLLAVAWGSISAEAVEARVLAPPHVAQGAPVSESEPLEQGEEATSAPAPQSDAPAALLDAGVLGAGSSGDGSPGGVPGRALRLVSGAPLEDPNVAVHTVEAKAYPEAGGLEAVLFPVAVQVNGLFTQHLGTMGSIIWHLHESFGLMLTGGGNWYAAESSFNQELARAASVVAQTASSLLWTWGVVGGVEVTPAYGKIALFERTLVQFDLVVNGGAGVGGTMHLIRPASQRADGSLSPATFGDTGVKFLGSLGAGLRVRVGPRFALRLEVRDVVYTARVGAVNGCNLGDLTAMDAALKSGGEASAATVSSSCQKARFSGRTAAGDARSSDVHPSLELVRGTNGVPSSDVLNNVGLYLGASFVF